MPPEQGQMGWPAFEGTQNDDELKNAMARHKKNTGGMSHSNVCWGQNYAPIRPKQHFQHKMSNPYMREE